MNDNPNPSTPQPNLKMAVRMDNNGKVYLAYTCPECKRRIRVSAKGLKAGSSITCPCGETTIDLKGDDLDTVQRALDSVGSAFQDVFKGLDFTFKM